MYASQFAFAKKQSYAAKCSWLAIFMLEGAVDSAPAFHYARKGLHAKGTSVCKEFEVLILLGFTD